MANYDAAARSSYFRVKDERAFRALFEDYVLDVVGKEDEDSVGEDGLVALLCVGGGGWPTGLGPDEDQDIADLVAPHLAEGWVAVFIEAGHEKLRCLVDGVGSVGVLEATLETEPSPAVRRSPLPALPPRPRHVGIWESAATHAPQPVARATATGVHAARAGLRAALHPSEMLVRSRGLAELLVRDEIKGRPGPRSNVQIGQGRGFAAVRVPLANLKRIADRLGGSVSTQSLPPVRPVYGNCCSSDMNACRQTACARWCR